MKTKNNMHLEHDDAMCTTCFEKEWVKRVGLETPELVDVVKDYTGVLHELPRTKTKCNVCGNSMRLSGVCHGEEMNELLELAKEDVSETELIQQALDYELENMFGSEPMLN